MPRYFFHVRDGRDFTDTEGTELPDLNAAQSEAIKASGEMLRGLKGGTDFWSGEEWTMTVTNEAGLPLLSLRFSGAKHV